MGAPQYNLDYISSLVNPKPNLDVIQQSVNSIKDQSTQSQITPESISAATQNTQPQFDYEAATKAGYTPVQIKNFTDSQGVGVTGAPQGWDKGLNQNTILPQQAQITENYGQYQPGIEVFSNGVTPGTGFAVDKGTPVGLPPGKWKIVDAFNGAGDGQIGDSTNSGWGNSVVAQNADTGESLRFSHLSDVHVRSGDTIKGGYIIGKTGTSGNSSGDHLNLAYYDPNGNPGDVLQSQWAQFISPSQ